MSVPLSTITAMPMDADDLLGKLARDPSRAPIGWLHRALPPGHVVDAPGGGPLYWVSEGAPTPEDVAWARAGFAVSGLWPLLIDIGEAETADPLGKPTVQQRTGHRPGEGPLPDASAIDPERWLAEWGPGLIADNEANDDYEPDQRVSAPAPAGTEWPGLAPGAAWEGHADQYADGMRSTSVDSGGIQWEPSLCDVVWAGRASGWFRRDRRMKAGPAV